MFTVSMNFNNFLLSYRVFAKLPGAPTLNGLYDPLQTNETKYGNYLGVTR